MANIKSTGGEGFADGYKGSMEANGTYSTAVMSWDYSWRNVEVFSDGGGIGMVDFGSEGKLCVWVEMRKLLLVVMSAFGLYFWDFLLPYVLWWVDVHTQT